MFKKSAVSREIFCFLAVSLLVFFILELIFPNILLAYFNFNILVLLFFLSAISLFYYRKD